MKKIILFLAILVSNSLFCQMPNTLSKADKVYGLSKFWQEVNYNFAYLYKVDREQWENEYKRLISEVQETNNDYEYYRLLEKFCAMLKDGHTNIFLPKEITKNILYDEFGEYKIVVGNIDHKAIVTRISLSKKNEIPIGSEIIKVNGLSTKEYITQYVKPYFSSSTEHVLEDYCVARLFEAPKGSTFDVQLKDPNGEIKDLKLSLQETSEKELYPAIDKKEAVEFKWLEDKTAYLGLHSFERSDKADSLFLEILPELYKAKKLIIDLRYNNGGSTSVGFNILQYLTNDNHLSGFIMSSRSHMPAYKAWGSWTQEQDTIGNKEAVKEYLSYRDIYYKEIPLEIGEVNIDAKRMVIPTVLLIGHQTASSAEDFLLFADSQKHMIKIGEPTYGSTGQPLFFRLPGGGSARVCTVKNTYTDGREFVGIGVLPDIKISQSYQDYMENKDVAFEKAVEILNKK